MKACWILTYFDDEPDGESSVRAVAPRVDGQLAAWTAACGIPLSGRSRWWLVESGPGAADNDSAGDLFEHARAFLYNPLRRTAGEVESRIGGDIDAIHGLTVVSVGDVRCRATRASLHCAGRALRLEAGRLFGATPVTAVAVLFIPLDLATREDRGEILAFLTELNTMMHHEFAAARPFDAVVIVQNGNISADNPKGYSELCVGDELELLSQVVTHLALAGPGRLVEEAARHATPFASMGAAGVFFEERVARSRLARELAGRILDRFTGRTPPLTINEHGAETAIEGLSGSASVQDLFRTLAGAADRPSFEFDGRVWDRARDARGHLVGPWQFWRPALLRVYFGGYLRMLPLRLSEYARLFLAVRLDAFRAYLARRRAIVWDGSDGQQGMRDQVLDAVRQSLSGKYGDARGFAQVRTVLARARALVDVDSISPALDATSEFADLRVFAVPPGLEELYERSAPILEQAEEERLHTAIADSISRHPSPVALLAGAALVAGMVAVLGDRLLAYLSPKVINLAWLQSVPWLAFFLLLAAPLVVAAFQYGILTVGELRRRVRRYVAAVLRHAQTFARDLVRRAIETLFADARNMCDRIETVLAHVTESLVYPSIQAPGLVATSFMLDLEGAVAVPGAATATPLLSSPVRYRCEVSGELIAPDSCSPTQIDRLVVGWLEARSGDDAPKVWQEIANDLPGPPATHALERVMEVLRDYAEGLFARDPERGVAGWLLDEANANRADALATLKAIAWPAVEISPGAVQSADASFEIAYGRTDRLNGLEEFRAVETGGEALLSLGGYVQLTTLADVASVVALKHDPGAVHSDRNISGASRAFTLATSGRDATLLGAADGVPFDGAADAALHGATVRDALVARGLLPPAIVDRDV